MGGDANPLVRAGVWMVAAGAWGLITHSMQPDGAPYLFSFMATAFCAVMCMFALYDVLKQ